MLGIHFARASRGLSLSIKRDEVTGSTLLGNKVKADITHINKKHSVNFMLKLNR